MVEFVTIDEKEVRFSENNFFEVAKKKAVTEDGDKPFVSITRGYYKDGKDKKFTKAISFPMNEGETTLEQVVEILQSYCKGDKE